MVRLKSISEMDTRIVVFDASGNFVREFGSIGRRAGRILHADRSRGVAGRNHHRRRPETPRLSAL